jgi:gamma-glutamyltranspeptidase/glutathione hydrolase
MPPTRNRRRSFAIATAILLPLALLLASCASAPSPPAGPAAASSGSATSAPPASAAAAAAAAPSTAAAGPMPRHAMVATANPLASQAGLEVLRAGGSAADAAVAVQAVLGLVEPQSSGLGGGAFITYYEASSRQVRSYNGRETAPAGATVDMFLGPDRQPLSRATGVLSGRSTGVPGAVAALSLLQHEHGKLQWRALFGAAERLANDGFVVSPRLASWVVSRAPQSNAPDVIRYFTKADGTRRAAGDILKNPAYALTVHRLAAEGARALYHGSIAADIVRRVHEEPIPGSLTLQDLARYRPIESEALCRPWRGLRVCTPPPPAGGVDVLQGLLLLEHTDIDTRNAADPVAWVQLGEAERLLYADRNLYVADPAFVAVPLAGLLDAAYLQGRAALIGDRIAINPPQAGVPPGAIQVGPDHTPEPGGTTHFVIVDAAGNVVSMTTTVESIFGSGRMVDGFFLNNQLTDFSFSPTDAEGRAAANAVAPGKRPRSAMAPTIVVDSEGRFVEAVGSAGGPAIISYVLKTLVATLDWHLSMQSAIALPNLVAHDANFSAEVAKFPPGFVDALNARGLNVHLGQYEESGLQGIRVGPDGSLDGGVDPRREGVALGY